MTEHPPPENLPTVAAMLEALDDDDDRRAVAELRDESTEAAGFRAAMNALAIMLIYNATR